MENKNNRIRHAVRRWRNDVEHTHTHYVRGCTKIIFIVNFINISPRKLSVRPSLSLSPSRLSQGVLFNKIYEGTTSATTTAAEHVPLPAVTFRLHTHAHTHWSRRRRRKFNITRARFSEHVQQTPPLHPILTDDCTHIVPACVPAHRIFGTHRLHCVPSAAPLICHITLCHSYHVSLFLKR